MYVYTSYITFLSARFSLCFLRVLTILARFWGPIPWLSWTWRDTSALANHTEVGDMSFSVLQGTPILCPVNFIYLLYVTVQILFIQYLNCIIKQLVDARVLLCALRGDNVLLPPEDYVKLYTCCLIKLIY